MWWQRKSVWDKIDLSCLIPGAIAAGIAAAVPADHKAVPAIIACLLNVSAGVAKYRSKQCEESDKAARREADQEREKEMECLRARTDTVARWMTNSILETMRSEYFKSEANVEAFKHRVTLFVCDDPDPQTGRARQLSIYSRSGVWTASECTWPLDDNEVSKCCGVAGRVWFHRTTLFEKAECDWPENENGYQMALYARSMQISLEKAKSLNVKSRSFAGTIVNVNGRPWGVLLLDSKKEEAIVEGAAQRKMIERYARMIGSALGEATT